MKRSTLAAILALGGAVALTGAPALAASQQQSSATAQTSASQSRQLPVVAASRLVGRALVDPQGHDAGRIQSLIIDTQTGAVKYVLIGGRGNFNVNGELAVAPWSVLSGETSNGAIRLNVSASKLANGPLINRRSVAQLNQPLAVGRVYGYYGYGRGRYPVGYGLPYGYYGGRYNYVPPAVNYRGANANVGNYRPFAGFNANGSNANGSNGNASNSSGSSSNGSNANASNGNGGNNNQLSVNQNGVVSALSSPLSMSPAGLRSVSVFTRNGKRVGSIDQVMIDTAHGMVAFVLVKRGGFLGLNPTWFAIPVEAIRWSSYQDRYQLTVAEQRLNQIPTVPANNGNLTNTVNTHALAQLYAAFNVSPYWTRSSSQGSSASG